MPTGPHEGHADTILSDDPGGDTPPEREGGTILSTGGLCKADILSRSAGRKLLKLAMDRAPDIAPVWLAPPKKNQPRVSKACRGGPLFAFRQSCQCARWEPRPGVIRSAPEGERTTGLKGGLGTRRSVVKTGGAHRDRGSLRRVSASTISRLVRLFSGATDRCRWVDEAGPGQLPTTPARLTLVDLSVN